MLNEYYQNVGLKGFFKRYGLVNALRRGAFTANPLHRVPDYEMRKVLWQRKVSAKIASYLRYQDQEPQDIQYSDRSPRDPVWIYWNSAIETAPPVIRRCCQAAVDFHGDRVIILSEENMPEYIRMPREIEEKRRSGVIPLAIYTDLMRVALLAHYGGTWMDATVYLTQPIAKEILASEFFVFRNSLGLLQNPALYPVWFIHAEKENPLICRIRNTLFAYWERENHLLEYLTSNLIFTQVIGQDPRAEAAIPYMNSDYSEYLVRQLGKPYCAEEFNWICGLTGIHKLTYKLDPAIDRPGSVYHHILGSEGREEEGTP